MEDYAFAARGLLFWSELDGNDADLETVRGLLERGWELFHSPAGWRLGEDLLLPIGSAEPAMTDGPMMSPSAVMLDTAWRLGRRQSDTGLQSRVLAAARLETEEMRRVPFSFASHITLLAEIEREQ